MAINQNTIEYRLSYFAHFDPPWCQQNNENHLLRVTYIYTASKIALYNRPPVNVRIQWRRLTSGHMTKMAVTVTPFNAPLYT